MLFPIFPKLLDLSFVLLEPLPTTKCQNKGCSVMPKRQRSILALKEYILLWQIVAKTANIHTVSSSGIEWNSVGKHWIIPNLALISKWYEDCYVRAGVSAGSIVQLAWLKCLDTPSYPKHLFNRNESEGERMLENGIRKPKWNTGYTIYRNMRKIKNRRWANLKLKMKHIRGRSIKTIKPREHKIINRPQWEEKKPQCTCSQYLNVGMFLW